MTNVQGVQQGCEIESKGTGMQREEPAEVISKAFSDLQVYGAMHIIRHGDGALERIPPEQWIRRWPAGRNAAYTLISGMEPAVDVEGVPFRCWGAQAWIFTAEKTFGPGVGDSQRGAV